VENGERRYGHGVAEREKHSHRDAFKDASVGALTLKLRLRLAFLILAVAVVVLGASSVVLGWRPVRDFVVHFLIQKAADHAGEAAVLLFGAAVWIVFKSEHWPRLTLFVEGALTAGMIVVISDVTVSLLTAPSNQWLSVDQAIQTFTPNDTDRRLYDKATRKLCIAETNMKQFQEINFVDTKLPPPVYQARAAELQQQINLTTNNRILPLKHMLDQLQRQLRQGKLVAQGSECGSPSFTPPINIPTENWELLHLEVFDQECDEYASADRAGNVRQCYSGIVLGRAARGTPNG
jgi:hypothetical protein